MATHWNARRYGLVALATALSFAFGPVAMAAKKKKKKKPAAVPAEAASGYTVAVLGLLNEGGVDEATIGAANDVILEKVKEASPKATKGNDLGAMMLLMGCSGPSADCISLIGSSMKVSKVVYGVVTPAGSAVKVSLTLFDVGSGSVEGNRSGNVPTTSVPGALGPMVSALMGVSSTGTLRVISSIPGATVTVDGSSVGTTPLTLSVEAGKHTVGVTAPGYKPLTENVKVELGATAEMTAEMEALPPTKPKEPVVTPTDPIDEGTSMVTPDPDPTPLVPPRTRSKGSPLLVPGLVAVAVGVGAAAAGGVMGILWLGERRKFDEAIAGFPTEVINGTTYLVLETRKGFMGTERLCRNADELTDTKRMELQSALDACKKGKLFTTLGWVLAGSGIGIAAAGLVLVLAGGGKKKTASLGDGGSFTLLPVIGPGVAGAELSVSF